MKKLLLILLLIGNTAGWSQGLFIGNPGYVVFRDSTLPMNDQLVQWFEFESMMDRRSVNGRGYIIFNGTDKRKVQVSSEHILKIIEKSQVDSSLLSSPAVIGDYKNLYSELINISKINNNVSQKSAPLISMMGDSIKKLDGQKTTIPNASQISVGTITTKDGSVYSNSVIKSSNDAYVTVQHNDGVTRIMLPNLPDSLQSKYKYNPEKSASFLAAEKESRKRLAQSQIEEQRKMEEKSRLDKERAEPANKAEQQGNSKEVADKEEQKAQADFANSTVGKRIGDSKEMFIKRYGNPTVDDSSEGLCFKTPRMKVNVIFENNKAVSINYTSIKPETDPRTSIGEVMLSADDNTKMVKKILATQSDGQWSTPTVKRSGPSSQTISFHTTDNTLDARWEYYPYDVFFNFTVCNRAWAEAKRTAQHKVDAENASRKTQSKLNDL